MKFILSIDQGTTGTTSFLVNAESLEVVDKVNQEYPQIFPKPSWVEHNLNDIWKSVEETVSKLLEKNSISGNQVISIGITNQRETICAFGKDGTPHCHALVWQDKRTSEFCQKNQDKSEWLREKTGLPIDPYFSGTKIHWLLNNSDQVKKARSENNLLFGTIDTFLLHKLTGTASYKTEASNASRTLLYNINSKSWDSELLDFFEVKQSELPDVAPSFGEFGRTQGLSFLPDGIPITGILGDQQAALFGQAGIKEGDLKCTYGTGAFLLLNIGTTPTLSSHGLLTTVFYEDQENTYYALEGSSFIAGAAVQWLRDNLEMINNSSDIEPLAREASLESCSRLLFYPYFSGIGSPYWKPDALGAILGLSRDSGKCEIARACLEGITLAINDLIQAMKKDLNGKMSNLKVDGGASINSLLLSLQASFSNLTIIRPEVLETTAYGAALASAIGVGLIKKEEVLDHWKSDIEVSPDMDNSFYYQNKLELWDQTIKRLFF